MIPKVSQGLFSGLFVTTGALAIATSLSESSTYDAAWLVFFLLDLPVAESASSTTSTTSATSASTTSSTTSTSSAWTTSSAGNRSSTESLFEIFAPTGLPAACDSCCSLSSVTSLVAWKRVSCPFSTKIRARASGVTRTLDCSSIFWSSRILSGSSRPLFSSIWMNCDALMNYSNSPNTDTVKLPKPASRPPSHATTLDA